jgi:hypothetical protein
MYVVKLNECLDLNNPFHVEIKNKVEAFQSKGLSEAQALSKTFEEYGVRYTPDTTISEPKQVQNDLEAKKADIERRRKENDSLGKSILQKLGYKNENRLPNGNVKGGQAGWKIRFNIKNPKTGKSYYDGKGTSTLLNDDYDKRAKTLINFLLSYFGSNEKADSKNLQKHYILEDKDGSKREPFKHLAGGEIGESDFTIYIGSADDVIKFISDIRTKHPEILELLHAGNKSEDVAIDDIFKGRIEGSKIGFSGYHAPTNLYKVTGLNDFTFNFNQDRVNINYNGNSLSDITIIVESSNKGYKGVFDENLKKDFPELYKNIRNIVGFQLYGDYLQGSNDEFLKLTGVDKINAKYDAELAALEQPIEEQAQEPFTPKEETNPLSKLKGKELLQSKQAVTEEESISNEEIQFIIDRFGEQTLNHLRNVVNSNAYGTWMNAIITLYSDAKRGTGYHEAWHHFSQMYLTQTQKSILYKQVLKQRPDLKTFLEVEEYLADEFKNFSLNGTTSLPSRNLFQQLWDWIKWVFTNQPSINRAFKQLYEGNLLNYTPGINNAMFGKLDASIKNSKGKTIFDNIEAPKVVKHFHYMLGKALEDAGLSVNILEDKYNNDVYTAIYQLLKQEVSKKDYLPNGVKQAFEKLQDEDNFKSFLNYSLEKLKFYGQDEEQQNDDENQAEEDNEKDEEIQEVANSENIYEKEQKSVYAESSPTIRKLISLLPKGKVVKLDEGFRIDEYEDQDGFKQTADVMRTYSLVAQHLAGSLDLDEMMTRLGQQELHLRIPEAKFLYDRMLQNYRDENGNPVMEQYVVNTMRQFYKTFNRVFVPVWTGFQQPSDLNEVGNIIFKEQTKDVLDKVKKYWQSIYLAQEPINEKTQLPQDNNGVLTLPQLIQLTNKLGLKLSENTLKSKEIQDLINNNYEVDGSGFGAGYIRYFLENLNARLKKGQKIENIFKDMSSKFEDLPAETRFLNHLLDIESKYSELYSTMMMKTTQGTKKNGLMLPNFFNRIGSVLRDKNIILETLPKQFHFLSKKVNKYVSNSLILNSLYDNNGVRKNLTKNQKMSFTFGDYNGFNMREFGIKEVPKETTSMTPREKMLFDIHALLIKGMIDIPRTESSSTSYFIKNDFYDIPITGMSIKTKDIPLPLNILYDLNEELTSTANEAIANIFTGYLLDEVQYGKISMLKDILTPEFQETVLKDFDPKTFKTKYANEVGRQVKQYIEESSKELEEIVNKYDLGSKFTTQIKVVGNKELSTNAIVKAFIINDLILKAEYTKIFDGPTSILKNYHKRAKINISTGIEMDTSNYAKQLLDARQQAGNTLRAKLDNTLPFYKHDVLKTRLLKDDIFKIPKIQIEKIKKAIRKLGEQQGLNEDKVKEKIKYLEQQWSKPINVGDGGGYITLDGYRQVLEQTGNWQKDELSIWYRVETLLFQKLILEKPLTQTEEEFVKKNENVVANAPVLKLQYAGNSASQENTPIAHKFAVTPLIPSQVMGNPVLQSLLIDMVKNGEVYAYFESASKKIKEGTRFSIYDDARRNYSNQEYKNSPEVYAQFLKEQIQTSFDLKQEVTWGTQMRKLFLANLFNSGMSSEKTKATYRDYIQVVKNFQDVERYKLIKGLGAEMQDGKLIVKDRKEFIENLIHEAKNQGLNQNMIDSIQYDVKNKDFLYSLDFNSNTSAIQDLISGIVYKRVVKSKVNGDMLIQVPSTGYAKQPKFYEPIYDKNGEIIGTKPATCKIALTEKHKPLLNLVHPDGNPIQTRQRLNDAIDNEDWIKKHSKHFSVISYRIPTQGPNSMEFFQVDEFLDASFGNGIVVPREITLKAGSDFDIDKLPSMFPSFDEFGNLVDDIFATKSEFEKQIIELEKEIKSKQLSNNLVNSIFDTEEINPEIERLDKGLQDLIKKYKTNVKIQKGFHTNKLIDIYYKTLSSAEMYEQLITPNDVNNIKPVAREMVDLLNLEGYDKQGNPLENKDTSIITQKTNMIKFVQFLSGKKDLGVFALANTFSQLIQIAGVKLNTAYRTKRMVGNETTYFERRNIQPLLNEEEKSLDISQNKDANGVSKQQILSELINATVDIANDPYYSSFGINNYNKGIVIAMLMQNIPFDRIIHFLNQPILRQYYERMDKQPYSYIEIKGKPRVIRSTYSHLSDLLGVKVNKGESRTNRLFENINTLGFKDEIIDPIKLKQSVVDGNVDQYKIAYYYLQLKEQADLFRNAQQSLSFDTKKFFSSIGAQHNLDLFQEVLDSGFFSEDLRNIKNESLISEFDSRTILTDVYENVLPVAYQKQLVSKAKSLLNEMFFTSKAEQYRFERTLTNDFIDFLVKQFGVVNQINFAQYGVSLLETNSGVNMANRLTDLRQKYPELFERYLILHHLRENDSEKLKNIRNIELNIGLENPVDLQDRMTEEFYDLIYFSDDKYNSEQIQEIRKFAEDLAYLGIAQSGFNKSYLYYTNIIPFDFIQPMLEQALSSYKQFENKDNLIQGFLKLFKNENPKFNLSVEPKQESYRGKYLIKEVIKPIVNQSENLKPTVESSKREYTPENITTLKPNEVFVFGSNTEGRHGKGAALTAKQKFGAKQGQAEGIQGQSYAIITKDLSKGERSVSLERIHEQLSEFVGYAENNLNNKFYVTKLGSSLAGYTESEIKNLFKRINDEEVIPDNVILPKEYEIRNELKNTDLDITQQLNSEQSECE